MAALNRARIKHLKNNTTAPLELKELEIALTSLNRAQGLGLVLAGGVVDLRTLKKAGSAIVSGAITISALLLGLSVDRRISTTAGACAVSDAQRSVIQAVMQANASMCSYYNVTLDEVLAGAQAP